MGEMSTPRWLALLLLLSAAACGATEAAGTGDGSPSAPVPTIGGVGALPDTIARESEPPVIIRPPVNEDGTIAELVGQRVSGNRIILLGDSILAATDRRYGGEMCDALVPLGWAVEVDAEPGRFVEFGNRVLDRRLDPTGGDDTGWDAAMVFLGSNYRGDQAAYEAELLEIVTRLAPRPTLLFTVTEYRSSWAEVNESVERIAAQFDNVVLVDWKTVAEAPGVLSSDRLHPTEAGELVLVDLTAAQLGRAPVGDGECLRSEFTDGSAVSSPGAESGGASADPTAASTSGGVRTGNSDSGSPGGGSSGGGAGPPPATAPPSTGAPSTSPPSTGTPSTSPATTAGPPPADPPTTDPPAPTSPPAPPPATSPPATSPPATSPPATAPPAPTAPPATSPPATSG